MPKKAKSRTKTISKADQKSNDFFFLTTMSVFAAVTIFAAQYMINAKKEAIEQARRQQALPVAQLELVNPDASPSPSPTPLTLPATPKPGQKSQVKPLELKVTP